VLNEAKGGKSGVLKGPQLQRRSRPPGGGAMCSDSKERRGNDVSRKVAFSVIRVQGRGKGGRI